MYVKEGKGILGECNSCVAILTAKGSGRREWGFRASEFWSMCLKNVSIYCRDEDQFDQAAMAV